jgi:hypothetical protein
MASPERITMIPTQTLNALKSAGHTPDTAIAELSLRDLVRIPRIGPTGIRALIHYAKDKT